MANQGFDCSEGFGKIPNKRVEVLVGTETLLATTVILVTKKDDKTENKLFFDNISLENGRQIDYNVNRDNLLFCLYIAQGEMMAVSYKKLWKLLIDRDMKKKDLEAQAEISHYVMHKLNHGENVTVDVLGKICKTLGCTLDDIVEFIDETNVIE